MREAEHIFIANPVIEQYKKKYILGIDSTAKAIFGELCSRRVHIDGFIDTQNAGIFFFHKPVWAMEELELNYENAILLCANISDELRRYHVCSEVCILNPKLYEKRVMIYGAGYIGRSIFSILRSNGIEVEGFIDSDDGKTDTLLCGKKVYGKEVLSALSPDIAIIEAGKGCYEIESIVRSYNGDLQRFYIMDLEYSLDGVWVDQMRGNKIMQVYLSQLAEYYEHEHIREIILYGKDIELARKYGEVLRCLDFQEVSYMTGEENSVEQDVPIIDEIVYKENYLLLLYEEGTKYPFDKLNDLGVKKRYCGDNISTSASNWSSFDAQRERLLLDIGLGYTFEANWKYPGIYVYGENHAEDYKIVVLGGSTTDSLRDPHIRSWVEFMYNRYCHKAITIFNGGIIGYNSSQELTKLIRDMMKLSPDMVIVYDGANDFPDGKRFSYLEKLVNFAGENIRDPDGTMAKGKEAWTGVPSKGDQIDGWLENIEYMYAIARSKNAEFFSFMQPCLFTKKNLDSHSRTLKLDSFEFLREASAAQRFRNRAKEIADTHSYIYDLTDIFDDLDVYLDHVHVYEHGNEIIAEHIWNVIEKCIKY